MNKFMFKLMASGLLLTALSCSMYSCKKNNPDQSTTDQSKSTQKEILTFEIFSADNGGLSKDYNSNFNGNNISVALPAGTNLTALKVAYTVSAKATVTVNGKLQTSQLSANDFTQPVTYVVKAEDGSTKSYNVTVTAK